MIARPRILALLAIAAAALLPAAAQAHWVHPCGCEPAPLYPYFHHYRHYHHRYADERYVAVELAPNTFAIPYRLRAYPYMRRAPAALWREQGYVDRTVSVREPAVVIEDGARRDSGQARTIKADAEVTILGPDRMNIRLFRKGRGTPIKSGD
jgi:hypothetical protein